MNESVTSDLELEINAGMKEVNSGLLCMEGIQMTSQFASSKFLVNSEKAMAIRPVLKDAHRHRSGIDFCEDIDFAQHVISMFVINHT